MSHRFWQVAQSKNVGKQSNQDCFGYEILFFRKKLVINAKRLSSIDILFIISEVSNAK